MKALHAFLIRSLQSAFALLITTSPYAIFAQSSPIELSNEKNIKTKLKTIENSSQVTIPNPNLLNLVGPKVSLIFKKAQAKKAFEYLLNSCFFCVHCAGEGRYIHPDCVRLVL